MTAFPRVGILYLTYGTKHWERDIVRAMSSLVTVNYPKDRIELICIESLAWNTGFKVKDWFDQNWMTKSGKELPHVTYVYNERKMGFAENNNAGYDKAKELGCEYVYLLNEDTAVDPDFLVRAVERMSSDPKIAFVQSLLLLGEEPDKVNTVGNAFHVLGFGYSHGYKWSRERATQHFNDERVTNQDLEIGYYSGAGALGRVSAIEASGGLFDTEFFMYHEDTDSSMRARIHGYKIVVEPRSVVSHYYEFVKSRWIYYYMDRNRYVMMFSYYRLWTLLVLFPLMVALDVPMFVFAILRGWWREKLKVYADWFKPSYWKWVLSRRKKIQQARVLSDRQFFQYVIPTIEFQEEAVKNPVLDYIGNPLMKAYFTIVKKIVQ